MKLSTFQQSFSGLKLENHFHRLVTLALLILNGVLLFALLNQKVIVTMQPWTMARDAQVTESQSSQSYIESWGLALAYQLGNITPANVDFVTDHVKPLLSPKIYQAAIDAMQANAESIREDRVAIRFEPKSTTYEKSTGKVFVFGTSFIRSGTGQDKERREPRTYEFLIKITNYLPEIEHIDTYIGVPHTTTVLEELAKKDVRQRERNRAERQEQKINLQAEEAKKELESAKEKIQ